MKLITMWVAQDSNGDCFVFTRKPIKKLGNVWYASNGKDLAYLGKNLLTKAELKKQPFKIAAMSFDKLNEMTEW